MYELRHAQIQITVRRISERLCTPFFQQFINSPHERSFLAVLRSRTKSDVEPAEGSDMKLECQNISLEVETVKLLCKPKIPVGQTVTLQE
jgi:hypothetical protein